MITMMMQSSELLRTKAATNTMPIDAKKMIVAMIRMGLNINFSCWKNPIKNPVPIREMMVPRVNMTIGIEVSVIHHI